MLAGVVWTVQLVVYPAFAVVGPTGVWARHHGEHSRRMAATVMVPWAAQGATLGLLLIRRPAGIPLPLLALTASLALATVVLTAAVAVPAHARLAAAYDQETSRRLLHANWLRVAAWTAGAGCALAMLTLHATEAAGG